MTLVRWSPFTESMNRFDPHGSLADLRSDVNRLFGTFFGPAASGSVTARSWAPAVDMYATRDDLVMAVELPGVPDKEVNVSVVGDVLSIRGQRPAPDETREARQYWNERWFGQFERHIGLPFPVNAAQVKASFKDGVLTITLPKAEAIRPREIKVEVA